MGALAMPFETLPLGFRFKPTDVELIDHYLRLKINGKEDEVSCIKEVDICRVEPWDLPDLSAIKTNDHEWFYFCPRDRKYPNGQRSNRATEAGYWKATGKDRTIKSRKMGLIGMKKTLVFYTGRAPKGKRTNWVIHEYRTTLQELDGSHPGQGAFVLCRLFKKADDIKQDDHDDASHSDDVETNILSPNPTNISQEEIRSEAGVVQASPLSIEQSVEQTEHCAVKTSDSMTSDTMYPDRPPMNEEMTHEADSHFSESIFFDYPHEPYYKWQSVQANQGPIGMDDIFPTDTGDGYYGFNMQDIDGRDPVSDFLSSVINPDGSICKEASHQGVPVVESDMWKNSSIKETGSCSGGSDVEVIQQQHDVGYICSITTDQSYNEPKGNKELLQNRLLVDDDDIFSDDALYKFCHSGTGDSMYYDQPLLDSVMKTEDGQLVGHNGIKLRSHIGEGQLPPSIISRQGAAPRRIRLHLEDEGNESNLIVTDRSWTPINGSDSATAISPDDFICLADLDKNITATDESNNVTKVEVVETGIKIKNHRQRSRPSSVKTVEQGVARRRIRLMKQSPELAEADAAKPLVAEVRSLSKEAGEKQCAETPDAGPDQNSSLLKRSVVHMMKIVMMVVLFMACIGLWIARSDFVLSS